MLSLFLACVAAHVCKFVHYLFFVVVFLIREAKIFGDEAQSRSALCTIWIQEEICGRHAQAIERIQKVIQVVQTDMDPAPPPSPAKKEKKMEAQSGVHEV